jgi:predicted HTH transcriptional regulator
MLTKTISSADALSLSDRQEDHFFDRKAAAIKGAKLQRIAVALANADGGEVLVEIDDDKDEPDARNRWHGANHIEDYNQHIQALTEVQPALPMELTLLKADGKPNYVLKIQIEKSQSVHKTSDGRSTSARGPSRFRSLTLPELQRSHLRKAQFRLKTTVSIMLSQKRSSTQVCWLNSWRTIRHARSRLNSPSTRT